MATDDRGQVKNPETDGRLKGNQAGDGSQNNQQNQSQNSSSDRGTGEPRDGRDRPNAQTKEDHQQTQSQNNQRQTSESQNNQQNQQSPGTDENGYPLAQDGTRDERHYDHGQGDVVNPETDGRLKENRDQTNNQSNSNQSQQRG